MKKLLITFKLALVLLMGATLVTVPTACTTTQQTVTYNTLYSVEKSTTAAYDSYLTLVVQGKLAKDGVPAVSKSFDRFQFGMQVAVSAAQFNWSAPAPAETIALATEVLNAILKAKGQ